MRAGGATKTRTQATKGATSACLRIATIDRDQRFLGSLAAGLMPLQWTLIKHPAAVSSSVLRNGSPHVALVDIDILGPRWDGWLVRQCEAAPDLPIVICTARSTVGQRVRGLQAGAEDWISKPCDVAELAARVQAILRGRRNDPLPAREDAPLRAGGLELRTDLFDAFARGTAAGLTRREFDIVLLLATHRGRVLSRETIYKRTWGYEMVAGDRSVDTFIRKIRAKLGAVSPSWEYIHTHKGQGYRFGAKRLGRRERP
jgi:DNA-binding response OmpR family regulator